MFKAIRFYNTGFAAIADERGEHEVSKLVAEYYLRLAENEYTHCVYTHYTNGDKEYIFS